MNTKTTLSTRRAIGDELVESGRKMNNLVVLEADISKSTYSCLFSDAFPERFINVGIAEQNLFGIAAGIATTGFVPVVTTYAVFASMRACEQIRTSICYPRLNVKICVSHGGVTSGNDGVTHQATEDLSMMRSIPGLTVIMPADYVTARLALKKALKMDGPVYIRLTRNPVPVIYDEKTHFTIGQAIFLREGCDITLIAIGDLVSRAILAADKLSEIGIEARVLDMHTIKPLDRQAIIDSIEKTGAIVSIEDNNIMGGLGGAIAELTSEICPVPVIRVGLKDTFAESGDYEKLLKKYGMDVENIVTAAEKAIKIKNWKKEL